MDMIFSCGVAEASISELYKYLIATLLTVSSLLLAFYGSLLSTYVSYRLSPNNNAMPLVVRVIVWLSRYMVLVVLVIAAVIAYSIFQLSCQQSPLISHSMALMLYIINLAILFPPILLVIMMQ